MPGSVIRGIQLSVGLTLAQKGVALVAFQSGTHYRGLAGWGGIIPGVAAAIFILVTTYWPVRGAACMFRARKLASSRACTGWTDKAAQCIDLRLWQQAHPLPGVGMHVQIHPSL